MRTAVTGACVALLVSYAIACGAEGANESPGFPPLMGVVTMSDGNGFVEYRRTIIYRQASGVEPRMEEVVTRVNFASDPNVRVFDLEGKVLKRGDAINKLKKGAAILISDDGELISDYYRQFFRPEIPVIVGARPFPASLQPPQRVQSPSPRSR
jgi:hypothetical protein